MADLMKYVEEQLDAINALQQQYDTELEKLSKTTQSPWEHIGGFMVRLTPEQMQTKIQMAATLANQLLRECDKAMGQIVKKTEARLSEEKKKVIQGIAAAETVPTQEQRDRMEMLRDEYPVIDSEQFRADMQAHVDNETVFAFPYYLLAKKEFAKNRENDAFLNDLYLKINPKVQEEKDKMKDVEQAINVFRSYVLLFRYQALDQVNNPDAHFERVCIINRVGEMGVTDVVRQINDFGNKPKNISIDVTNQISVPYNEWQKMIAEESA